MEDNDAARLAAQIEEVAVDALRLAQAQWDQRAAELTAQVLKLQGANMALELIAGHLEKAAPQVARTEILALLDVALENCPPDLAAQHRDGYEAVVRDHRGPLSRR